MMRTGSGVMTAVAAALFVGVAWAGEDAVDTFDAPSPEDSLQGTASSTVAGAPEADPEWADASVAEGRRLFRAVCAGCHGMRGDGNGIAAESLEPRPRDLTAGEYRFRSTPVGALPLRSDIMKTLSRGLPGTAMVGWKDQLSESEMRSLVLYLESLSRRFAEARAEGTSPEVVVDATRVKEAPVSPELVEKGRVIYEQMKCGDCHGPLGHGDGESAPTLQDNDGRKSHVFDFTYGVYKGGTGPIDVYRTFMTGLSGTPMPAYAPSLPDEADRWALVHYVRSLARERGVWFYFSERPTWREPMIDE